MQVLDLQKRQACDPSFLVIERFCARFVMSW
jgi:hypothetical protein